MKIEQEIREELEITEHEFSALVESMKRAQESQITTWIEYEDDVNMEETKYRLLEEKIRTLSWVLENN